MERKDLNFVDLNNGTSIWAEIKGKTDIYSVRVFLDNRGDFVYGGSSCSCVGMSFYLQTKKNREMKKICKHLQEVLSLVGKEEKSLVEGKRTQIKGIIEDSLTKLWDNKYDERWNNE